ncbi:MAG: hypothetical protein M3464_12385 [Chloroflexota bacterium]|nr:hypothetical protein [Chloroflexota bacterium]
MGELLIVEGRQDGGSVGAMSRRRALKGLAASLAAFAGLLRAERPIGAERRRASRNNISVTNTNTNANTNNAGRAGIAGFNNQPNASGSSNRVSVVDTKRRRRRRGNNNDVRVTSRDTNTNTNRNTNHGR